MKKGLLFTLILLFSLSLAAQAQIRFGVKAGVNIVEPSLDSDIFNTDNFTGFHVGPTFEFELPIIGLDIDAAVVYSLQGLKIKGEDSGIEYSKKMKQHTIDIPVNLKYKFDLVVMDFFVSAGPYIRFNFDDDFEDVEKPVSELKETWKSRSFGAGLNFGIGVELFSHLQIGVSYQLGLTNDYSSTIEILDGDNIRKFKSDDAQSRGWIISAAYFF